MIFSRFDLGRVRCIGIRCISNQRRSNTIYKHILSIKFNFKWFPFFDYFVNPFAKIFWFKMSSGLWTLILLACILVCIYSFIIIEVNIFFIILLLLLLLQFILIFLIIRKLVQIISFLMIDSFGALEMQIMLFGMDPSLLICLSIHFFL